MKLRFRRTDLVQRLFVCFTILMLSPCDANASSFQDLPEPMTLIHGVEEVRAAIPAGRIEWTVQLQDHTKPRKGVHIRRVEVAMDGIKRRFDQRERVLMIDSTKPESKDADRKLTAMGGNEEEFVRTGLGEFKDVHTTSAFDGEKYMQYGKDLGATILDSRRGTVEYLFDPRVYGLTFWYTLDDTVPGVFGYREAKSIRTIGREALDGGQVFHILIIDKIDRERHFWIEPNDFRIIKSEIRDQYERRTSNCTYDRTAAYSQLPTQVVLRKYDRDQKLTNTSTFRIERAVVGSVDPAGWTLAGLGMPLGQSMFDARTRKVAGNFDGQELTQGIVAAVEKGRALELANRRSRWWWAVLGLIVVAIVAAILTRKFNILRRTEG